MADSIYKGDDTGAFGNRFITVTVRNPEQYPISKIVAVTNGGCQIPNKTFTDDENHFQIGTIELVINYSSTESINLGATNTLNLVVFDMENKQSTCPQTLTFTAKNGVLCKCLN